MASTKFVLLKGKSRDLQDHFVSRQTHAMNLALGGPPSPIPSTSRGFGFEEDYNGFDEFAAMTIQSDDEDDSETVASPQPSTSKQEQAVVKYEQLPSTNATSMTTLDLVDRSESLDSHTLELATPDDATSVDAHSLQLDEISVYSDDSKQTNTPTNNNSNKKKKKKNKGKEQQQQMSDRDMWQASNYQVIQHMLNRSGSLDEQIKWEAIAMSRGLCTLRNNCTCRDCARAPPPQPLSDGDGGLAAAPLLGAVSVGCALQ